MAEEIQDEVMNESTKKEERGYEMASTKKDTKNGETIAEASPAGFDWGNYLPDGYEAKDLREVGLLTPMYIPEMAMELGFPPLFGKIDRIETLPTQRLGQRDQWTPRIIRMVSLVKTKAVSGTKEDRQVVDINPGDDVVFPIGGVLGVNRELMLAATDEKTVWTMGIRVRGTKPIKDRPQDAWDWEVMVHPKTEPRSGRFAFPQAGGEEARQLGATAPGQVLNKDGSPAGSLIGAR